MKCQQCDKPATFHITELTGGKPQELHLCEEHARQYLTQSRRRAGRRAPSLAGVLAQQLAVGQTAEELAKLDQQACPVCGITFYEFRNQGRLGCPLRLRLLPGRAGAADRRTSTARRSTSARSPPRYAEGTEKRTQLIRLRREMKEAIDDEDYERASQLRDEIRRSRKRRQVERARTRIGQEDDAAGVGRWNELRWNSTN